MRRSEAASRVPFSRFSSLSFWWPAFSRSSHCLAGRRRESPPRPPLFRRSAPPPTPLDRRPPRPERKGGAEAPAGPGVRPSSSTAGAPQASDDDVYALEVHEPRRAHEQRLVAKRDPYAPPVSVGARRRASRRRAAAADDVRPPLAARADTNQGLPSSQSTPREFGKSKPMTSASRIGSAQRVPARLSASVRGPARRRGTLPRAVGAIGEAVTGQEQPPEAPGRGYGDDYGPGGRAPPDRHGRRHVVRRAESAPRRSRGDARRRAPQAPVENDAQRL